MKGTQALLLVFMFALGTTHPSPLEPLMSLRPEPSSEVLPIVDLKEDPPTEFDPNYADLDHDRLRQKLGIHFQEDFMSYEPPPKITQEKAPVKFKKMKSVIPDEMKNLRLNRRQKRKLYTWMWERTSCPVQYKWHDIGVRFWPRWIKVGECDSTKSCSIPKGMGCQPSKKTNLTILRWHCQGILLNKKYCTWLKCEYPIITDCQCGC